MNKFKINQKVKFLNEPDNKAGVIVGINFNKDSCMYKITSKYVDMSAEKIIEGFRTAREDELVEVIDENKEN